MGRLWQSGFELNSTALEWTTSSGAALSIQSTTARSGTYAGQITGLTSGTPSGWLYEYSASTSAGPYWFRVAVNLSALPSATTSIIGINATNGIGSFNDDVSINVTSGGQLQLTDTNGTQIGSNSSALSLNTWYYIEFHIDYTGGSGHGVQEARLNGTVFATTSVSTSGVNGMSLTIGGNMNSQTDTSMTIYFDDIAINDSSGSNQNGYPGDGHITHIHPSAAGDNTGWTIFAGTSNWNAVSEVTPNGNTNAIQTATASTLDDYAVSVPGSIGSSDTINVVAVGGYFEGTATSANASFAFRVKSTSGGTVTESSSITPTTTGYLINALSAPRNYPLVTYAQPSGGSWTESSLTTAQIGLDLKTANTNKVRVSTVWMSVDSTPATVVPTYSYANNRIPNPYVGPMALRRMFRPTYVPLSPPPPPGTPIGLTVSADNEYRARIYWTAADSTQTNFVLQRSTSPGSGYVTIASPTATYYMDTSLSANTTYYYRVAAVNGSGSSAYTTYQSCTTLSANSPWTAHIWGWLYPTATFSPNSEITDGRVIYGLKPEYYTVNSSGVVTQETVSGGSGTYAYSSTNAAIVKGYSDQQFITISCGVYANFQALMNSSTNQTNAISALQTFCTSNGFSGVEIDFEKYSSWTSTDYSNFKTFLTNLVSTFHSYGLKVMVDVPPIGISTTYSDLAQSYYQLKYEDIAGIVDFICPLVYDYQYDYSSGTAVQPIAWMQTVVNWAISKLGWSNVNQIVIGMPSYGYYGATGGYTITDGVPYNTMATQTGFSGATRDSGSGEMNWTNGGNSYWYADTTTLNTKRQAIEDMGILNVSVWFLGGNKWFSGRLEPAPPALSTSAGTVNLTTDNFSTTAGNSTLEKANILNTTAGLITLESTSRKTVAGQATLETTKLATSAGLVPLEAATRNTSAGIVTLEVVNRITSAGNATIEATSRYDSAGLVSLESTSRKTVAGNTTLEAIEPLYGYRINFVPNPSFEADALTVIPNLWSAYLSGGSYTFKGVANDWAQYGSNSLKITATSNTDNGIYTQITGLTIGSKITLSAWIKTDSSVTNAALVLDTSQHSAGGSTTTNVNVGASYNAVKSVSMTLDSTKVNIFLGLGSWGPQSIGNVWFDGIMIEVSNSAGTYFDGATNGGTWTGTPNASTSEISPYPITSAGNTTLEATVRNTSAGNVTLEESNVRSTSAGSVTLESTSRNTTAGNVALELVASKSTSAGDTTLESTSRNTSAGNATLELTNIVKTSAGNTTLESTTLKTSAGNIILEAVTQGIRTNMMPNPSFEISGTWGIHNNGGGGTVTLPSSDYALYGSNSAKVVNANSSNTTFLAYTFAVVPGLTYTASVWVKVTSYTSNNAAIRFESTSFASLTSTSFNGVQGWTRYSITYTVPGTGVPSGSPNQMQLILDWLVGTYYFDGVLLEQSSSVGSYFDGANSGQWTGTANASQSIQVDMADTAGIVPLESTTRATSAGNTTLEETARKTSAGQVTLEAITRSTSAGNTTLQNSSVYSTTAGSTTLEVIVPRTSPGLITLELTNLKSTSAGQATLEVTARSTTAANATLESTSRKTSAGNATLESTSRKTIAGSVTLEDVAPSAAPTTTLVAENMLQAPTTGTLGGSPVPAWNPNGYLVLTTPTNSQHGTIDYTNALPSNFEAIFDFYTGGGSGADAVWFYFGSAYAPSAEDDGGAGGYAFAYDEYGGENQPFQINKTGNSVVASTGSASFANSQWHQARVIVNGSTMTMYLDGSIVLSYTDPSFSTMGNHFGWGARTGGQNNNHWVRNIAILVTDNNITSAGAVQLENTSRFTSSGSVALEPTAVKTSAGKANLEPTTLSTSAGYVWLTGSLPPSWLDTDVQSPAIIGAADYSGGMFTDIGGGTDIWGTTDQFHFIYEQVSGDATITARLTSQTNTSVWAKAGVIIKQSTTALSNYALMAATPGEGLTYQVDFGYNDNSQTYSFPIWLRVTRQGNNLSGYYSTDGISWTQYDSTQTVTLTNPIDVGLATTAHSGSAYSVATFDNVSITQYATSAGSVTLEKPTTAVAAAGSVQLEKTTLSTTSGSTTLQTARTQATGGTVRLEATHLSASAGFTTLEVKTVSPSAGTATLVLPPAQFSNSAGAVLLDVYRPDTVYSANASGNNFNGNAKLNSITSAASAATPTKTSASNGAVTATQSNGMITASHQ